MNPLNSLIHALQAHGGYATSAQLEAVRPKIKDVMKSSVTLVDEGLGEWVDGPSGVQELSLTEKCLAMMAPNARKMTHAQLREALERGDDLTGFQILVVKD